MEQGIIVIGTAPMFLGGGVPQTGRGGTAARSASAGNARLRRGPG